MSTPLGGLAPRTVAGQVIQPTAVIDGKSEAAHGLANVLRTLVQRSVGVYHNENDVDAAMQAISDFEKSQINSSTLSALTNEHDPQAAKEDVSMRVPAVAGGPVAATISQSIDYNRLAAAVAAHMLAAQAQQAETPEDASE